MPVSTKSKKPTSASDSKASKRVISTLKAPDASKASNKGTSKPTASKVASKEVAPKEARAAKQAKQSKEVAAKPSKSKASEAVAGDSSHKKKIAIEQAPPITSKRAAVKLLGVSPAVRRAEQAIPAPASAVQKVQIRIPRVAREVEILRDDEADDEDGRLRASSSRSTSPAMVRAKARAEAEARRDKAEAAAAKVMALRALSATEMDESTISTALVSPSPSIKKIRSRTSSPPKLRDGTSSPSKLRDGTSSPLKLRDGTSSPPKLRESLGAAREAVGVALRALDAQSTVEAVSKRDSAELRLWLRDECDVNEVILDRTVRASHRSTTVPSHPCPLTLCPALTPLSHCNFLPPIPYLPLNTPQYDSSLPLRSLPPSLPPSPVTSGKGLARRGVLHRS